VGTCPLETKQIARKVWAIAIILFAFSWRGSLNTYKVQNKAPWEAQTRTPF
jgi:hypothetical protein